MMMNATIAAPPHKVGFSSKNPFGDFTSFEESVEKMQPIVPEKTFAVMQKNLEQKKKERQQTAKAEKTQIIKSEPGKQAQSLNQHSQSQIQNPQKEPKPE